MPAFLLVLLPALAAFALGLLIAWLIWGLGPRGGPRGGRRV